jgi:CspA family cold shock protein
VTRLTARRVLSLMARYALEHEQDVVLVLAVGHGVIDIPGRDDVFVHYSAIQMSGFRILEEGQRVEFDVGPGQKGEEAQNVRVV